MNIIQSHFVPRQVQIGENSVCHSLFLGFCIAENMPTESDPCKTILQTFDVGYLLKTLKMANSAATVFPEPVGAPRRTLQSV